MHALDRSPQADEPLQAPLESARMDNSASSVVSLSEADADDKADCASRPPTARLEALEFMRQVVYGYDPIGDRIQRVC
jgi:hypothetical protein